MQQLQGEKKNKSLSIALKIEETRCVHGYMGIPVLEYW